MKKLCTLLALLCLLLATACNQTQPKEKNISLQGTTEAVLYTVKAPAEGEIRGLILDKGERIRKGQPLFGLGTQDKDPEVEKAATELAKAQARLNNASDENSEANRAAAAAAVQNAQGQVQAAEQNYAKLQRLFAIGGISKIKMQQAQQELDMARATLSAAQARFERVSHTYTPEEIAALKKQTEEARAAYDGAVLTVEGSEIVSPATGIVREIWLKNGDPATKDQPVMQILSSTDCVIKVSAKTADTRLKEGMEASVTAPGIRKPFPARIRSIEQNTLTLFSNQKPEELPDGTAVEISVPLPSDGK